MRRPVDDANHHLPSDLSQRTLEILERVHEGELAVVESEGEERIVLLDALDYRPLRALALYATGGDAKRSAGRPSPPRLPGREELLQLSRFELEESFLRLGIPLRRGARSIEDAQAEIAATRRHA